MRLIPNWRRAWRMFSVQAQALAFAILGGWQVMPEDLKAALPAEAVFWCAMALLVAGILGRLVDQPKARGEP